MENLLYANHTATEDCVATILLYYIRALPSRNFAFRVCVCCGATYLANRSGPFLLVLLLLLLALSAVFSFAAAELPNRSTYLRLSFFCLSHTPHANQETAARAIVVEPTINLLQRCSDDNITTDSTTVTVCSCRSCLRPNAQQSHCGVSRSLQRRGVTGAS